MLKISLLILSLASLGSSRLMSSSLTQRIMPREANSCEERKSPGLICESCELLSICVNHSNGWFNIPVETCETENGFYCNSQLGMCSNMTGPCHPFAFEGNFPCTSPGVFPDPYDCQKYHMCYLVGGALISATVDCGGTTAFDPATGQCSLSQFDSVCTMKQFHCNRVGDAGPWPRNSNIFYICKATSNSEDRVLYPTLYRCGDGEIFDGYYCHDGNPQFTTQPGSWQTSTTQRPGEMTSTSSTTSTTVRPSEMCSTIGLFPDTQNCRKYYYCSAISGEMKHFDCPMGTIYSPSLSSCIFGSC